MFVLRDKTRKQIKHMNKLNRPRNILVICACIFLLTSFICCTIASDVAEETIYQPINLKTIKKDIIDPVILTVVKPNLTKMGLHDKTESFTEGDTHICVNCKEEITGNRPSYAFLIAENRLGYTVDYVEYYLCADCFEPLGELFQTLPNKQ